MSKIDANNRYVLDNPPQWATYEQHALTLCQHGTMAGFNGIARMPIPKPNREGEPKPDTSDVWGYALGAVSQETCAEIEAKMCPKLLKQIREAVA